MEGSPALLTWIIVVSALVTLSLIVGVAAVLWWHQRRLASQARAWGLSLLETQEAERQRIAKDLHDDVVQRLWSAQMQIESGNVPAAATAISDVSRDLRILARDLYPAALQHLTLGRALLDLTELQPAGVTPRITCRCDDTLELPAPLMVALFRVAQEALHNARKHSRGQNVECRFFKSDRSAVLTVSDDGCGFDTATAKRHSFGLRSMQERLALVGGSLELKSASGSGTTLTARVPCE